MIAANTSKPRQEPFGILALVLALILIVVPIERELLWELHRSGKDTAALVVWCVCFIVVAAPGLVSWRRVRLQPANWRRPYETLILVASLLAFSIFSLVVFLVGDAKII